MTKKKKKVVTILAVLAGIFALLFFKNPNMRTWKNAAGEKVDISEYPMQWSFFSNEVTVKGRDDLKGIWQGNKLTWGAGNYWTC